MLLHKAIRESSHGDLIELKQQIKAQKEMSINFANF